MIQIGTAGFRDKSNVILQHSKQIGYCVGKLIYNFEELHKKMFGIMITASHNHYEDNGLKFVLSNGEMIKEIHEKFIIA